MKAFIIYDDFDLAAKANAMLERTAHQADLTLQWDIKPWRLDTLKLPAIAVRALAEAVEAHLVVLAIYRVKPVQDSLMSWLEKWAAGRENPDAALAVIGEKKNGVSSTSGMAEFARFTGRHGLSFIRDIDPNTNEGVTQFFQDSHKQNLTSPPFRPHLLDTPVRDSNRHWGINE